MTFLGFLLMFLFIFETERQRKRDRELTEEGQRERRRERIPSRFHTVSTEPDAGLELTHREITT